MSGPSPTWLGRAWGDLFTSELAARSAQHNVTRRALLYLEAGMPLDQLLDALKLTESKWDDRVAALGVWEAKNRAAAARVAAGPVSS